MSTADTAMFCHAFPCNPRPFLTALRDHLAAGGDIRGDHAKRILWTLIGIVRSQLERIDLGGNACFHRKHLARLDGRTTALGVIAAMEREAEGLDTSFTRHQWHSSIASLIFFAWGHEGEFSMFEEFTRLEAAWEKSQLIAA